MNKMIRIQKRLKVLYYIFLALILTVGIGSFVVGFNDGYHSVLRAQSIEEKEYILKPMKKENWLVKNFKQKESRKLVIDTVIDNDSIRVVAFENDVSYDMLVEGNQGVGIFGWRMAIFILIRLVFCFAVLGMIVVMVMFLINVGRSIARKDIFNRKTVRLCRWFAVLVVVTTLGMGLSELIESMSVVEYLDGTGWVVDQMSYSVVVDGVVTGVLFLLFAEILSMGCILKEEQDLTV